MRALLLAVIGVLLMPAALAQPSVRIASFHLIDARGIGQPIGQVRFEESEWGLLIFPDLHFLPPGLHGFHLHTLPNCGPDEREGRMEPGLAAGGHYDPGNTEQHLGPYDANGHLGDLPALYVTDQGRAFLPLLAPRLTLKDVAGRAVMIHRGVDNYTDYPQPLGGGGQRIACAVVEWP